MLQIQRFNYPENFKVQGSATSLPEGRIGQNIDFLSFEQVTAASWVRLRLGETEERRVSRWQHTCMNTL